ncbi:MAG: hypothetical protein A2381_01420 [Bdellovibrionales bacterium RIFOXYB1_FULL_37_110]|nr:MAG: hypothetical protein A2417_02275 [Bdellovibrionales bacterium RIFOXYC1_FULL_37_79]OFZ58876.1 MAG: hypothetical protein A2381_01420 [Bdellovibrionales bacterium RIFOXYB1_FULL_37_110]OFZ64678.1 MAG: hypothetical protein A2577_13515 [Bdellovibrionales bacterium RIFOXYD1_FULL_36_51]
MRRNGKPQKHGTKFRIRWIDENFKRQSSVHNTSKEAQLALMENKLKVEEIKSGRAHRYDDNKSFCDLIDYWLQHVAPTKRSHKDQISIIEAHLRPFFGSMKLKDITREHVHIFIQSKNHLSNKTISNHLILFMSMLNCSYDMRWIQEVPRIKKPKICRSPHAFAYLKNDDEIKRFLNAARSVKNYLDF